MKRLVRASLAETEYSYLGSGKESDRRNGVFNMLGHNVPILGTSYSLAITQVKPLFDTAALRIDLSINCELIKSTKPKRAADYGDTVPFRKGLKVHYRGLTEDEFISVYSDFAEMTDEELDAIYFASK